MKTMNRMQMRMRMQENGCRCQMMMAMAMKGSVYIIIGKEQIKHKKLIFLKNVHKIYYSFLFLINKGMLCYYKNYFGFFNNKDK